MQKKKTLKNLLLPNFCNRVMFLVIYNTSASKFNLFLFFTLPLLKDRRYIRIIFYRSISQILSYYISSFLFSFSVSCLYILLCNLLMFYDEGLETINPFELYLKIFRRPIPEIPWLFFSKIFVYSLTALLGHTVNKYIFYFLL